MNLHNKISLAFVAIVAIFAFGSSLSLSRTLIPAFDQLEERAALDNLAQVIKGVSAYGARLASASANWAPWNSTYDYIQGRNPTFPETNLGASTMLNESLNVMAFYAPSGKLRWGLYVDPSTGEESPVGESVISAASLALLQRHDSPESVLNGLVMGQLGPMLVSSRPIVREDRSGAVAGTVIVGLLLNSSRIAELRELAGVDVEINPLSLLDDNIIEGRALAGIFGSVHQEIAASDRYLNQVMHDIHGAAVGMMTVRTSRDITGLERGTVRSIVFLFVSLGAVVVIGLWFVIRYLVVQPIAQLRASMISIQQGGELSEQLRIRRSDEIGDLASSFDSMLQELKEAKRRHIDQSFSAGMAEAAAGVLHNVRNSLMPIINYVELAQDSSNHIANENIGRSIDELQSGNPPADRREKLLRYLNIAYENASDERNAVSASLDQASHQLGQVVEILREQEQYTHAKPILEKVNLGEVIGEARNVIPNCSDLDVCIVIDDALAKYDVCAHRIGLIQVFGNILLNAYESIRRSGRNEGEINVIVSAEPQGAETEIHITIRDSGAGIDDAALEQVFTRGYTSKYNGPGGLGLHWSANALASMQGRISVASDGRDKGAEFCVTLSADQGSRKRNG